MKIAHKRVQVKKVGLKFVPSINVDMTGFIRVWVQRGTN